MPDKSRTRGAATSSNQPGGLRARSAGEPLAETRRARSALDLVVAAFDIVRPVFFLSDLLLERGVPFSLSWNLGASWERDCRPSALARALAMTDAAAMASSSTSHKQYWTSASR
jgi:hypothetical protein